MNGASIQMLPATTRWTAYGAVSLMCVMAGLTACSNGHKGKSSQVVAVVNDKEITVVQLNRVLRSVGAEHVTPELTRQALESLADEELLVQAALKQKIDRDPAFVQALEQSRRELLGRIFAERAVYPKATISANEVQDYYRSEPLLFSNRRKFVFTTFLAEQSDVTSQVDSELNSVTSVDQVRSILDRHAIKYVTQMASVAPEQIPVNQLARFSKASVGDLFIQEQTGGKVMLMSLTSIDDDVPLTLERARPMIEGYLRNSRNKQATGEFLKQARATAKILYFPPGEKAAPLQASTTVPPASGTAANADYPTQAAGGIN